MSVSRDLVSGPVTSLDWQAARNADRRRVWADAAVFGGLWGAVEITIGGFLHMLRLPLCGVLMAAMEAGFLVAVRQICGRRWTVLGVATVAAFVRGLAPVGALFSPMLGIFAGGLLVEVSFLVLPGRWLPAILGGALCPLWSVAQYVLRQLLLFGSKIWDIYEVIFRGVQRTVGGSLAELSLVVSVGMLAILGGACGGWGLRLGTRARARLDAARSEMEAGR